MSAFLGFLDFVCIVVIVLFFALMILNIIRKRSIKGTAITLALAFIILCVSTFIAVTYFYTPADEVETKVNNRNFKEEPVSTTESQEQTKEAETSIQEIIEDQVTELETVHETEKELPVPEPLSLETPSIASAEIQSDSDETSEYLSVSASDIIDLFRDNQVRCKKLYDKKEMRITGKIDSIGTDILGKAYVCLGHDKSFTFVGIQCFAKDNATKEKISELSKGDIITVEGVGDCGSMSFSLRKAHIVK